MVSHEIIGDDMQAVVLTLGAGDEVRAEAGAMTYMTEGIEMDARMQGGILGGLKRRFSPARVSSSPFSAARFPRRRSRSPGRTRARSSGCRCRTARCSASAIRSSAPAGKIEINVEFTKRLGAGFFGGEGFILERLEGTGEAFIHSGGTIILKELKAGREAAGRHRLPRRVRPDGRLRHPVRRRHQDRGLRRGRAVLRLDDRAGPRVDSDAAVLAPRRSHHLRPAGRSRRSEARFRRRVRRARRSDRAETVRTAPCSRGGNQISIVTAA